MEAEESPPIAEYLCAGRAGEPEEGWLARMEGLLPRAIGELPAGERYVIRAYFFDELPLSALARDLELPPAEVSALIQSALQQLRCRLLL